VIHRRAPRPGLAARTGFCKDWGASYSYAGTPAEPVEARATTGDVLYGPERVDDRLAVGVDSPLTVFRGGVVPRDREHLDFLAHKVFDHASARRDIQDGVLVDQWGIIKGGTG
jgi:hypothetical protein